MIETIQHFLTPRRLGYAWLAGGALWLAWLISVLLGPGDLDLAGQVVGTDYLQFYTAGVTLRQGESARLYDLAYQSELERKIIGPDLQSYHAFITPPFLAWLFVPFSWLPYGWSFILWSGLGLVGLWLSLKWLGLSSPTKGLVWSLSWFPAFAAISFGQNGLLSLTILSLTYALWRKERGFTAGVVCSLILYKPQLALGIGLLWLIEWRHGHITSARSLAGLALGGGALAIMSFCLLPEASLTYVDFARRVLPDLPSWQDFPIWHLHTVRGFWRLLLPEAKLPQLKWVADGLTGVCALIGVGGFWILWRNTSRKYNLQDRMPILYSLATCLTIWLTPHAMIYDWVILLIPATLFWQHLPDDRPTWKVLFALVWAATFFSSPLTFAQLKILPLAVQISVPVLVIVLWQIYLRLQNTPAEFKPPSSITV